jgi:BirA family transcriptional regulator, biotin operon repressor / biotin---[acetyl-CoA-carboxylase] ligase
MKFLDKKIICLKSTDSTNAYAERYLSRKKTKEELVFLADYQSKGRGQQDHVWISESGKNLLVSIIIYPQHLPPEHVFILNKVASLSILYCLEKYLGKGTMKIKWPNDIYYRDKKIAGILINNTFEGSLLSHSILGMGINVNQREFPAELPNPVSVFQIINKEIQLSEILKHLLRKLDHIYPYTNDPDFTFINSNYHQNLYLLNRKSAFRDNMGRKFKGSVSGVDDMGRLEILLEKESKTFSFKDIFFCS